MTLTIATGEVDREAETLSPAILASVDQTSDAHRLILQQWHLSALAQARAVVKRLAIRTGETLLTCVCLLIAIEAWQAYGVWRDREA